MSLGFTKILRDLWLNRARTSLVVLAIALSVMAFGVLNTTYNVVLYNFTTAYEQAEPAQVILTLPAFDETLVEKVRALPEVRLAEGRRLFNLRVISDGKARLIYTYASLDPINNRINRLAWDGAPPDELHAGEVLLDRTFDALTPVTSGQTLTLQDMDGNSHDLKIAGLPNDLTSIPSRYNMTGQAFMHMDTAETLGQQPEFNQLLVVTRAEGDDQSALQAEIQRQATRITETVEAEGYPVLAVEVPVPNQPPLQGVVRTLLMSLQLFGFLIVLLAVLVVSNVAVALIAEQTRQVGILKSIGSRSSRVLWIYSQMVLVIGGIALLIALPLVWILTRLLVRLLAGMIDAQLLRVTFPLSTWIVLPLLAFGITFLAVIGPIWRASRLSVREAISEESPQMAVERAGFGVGSLLVRNSLRLLLRKRYRLILNLLMLGVAGAMFIAALNVRSEVQASVARVQLRRNYDAQAVISKPVDRAALEDSARKVSGVRAAQAFYRGSIGRILPDGTQAGNVMLFAYPAGSDFVHPWLVSGKYPLQPKGVLVSAEVADLWGMGGAGQAEIGQALHLTAAGKEAKDWTLDGTLGKLNMGTVYADLASYTELIGQENLANGVAVRFDTGVDGQAATDRLLSQLEQDGYSLERVDYIPAANSAETTSYNIIVYMLFLVVALTTLVGGLGLMSTLGISVMERRREIGILRSMGSRPALIRRLVITEGLLTALISLPLSYILSWPLTLALGRAVVMGITAIPPQPVYRFEVALVWAVLVCSLALLSSWLPARQAGRLSIREALIYQG